MILEKPVPGVSAAVLERFVLKARRSAGLKGKVNVLLTGSPTLRRLNRQYLRKDKPTDVLSFPAPDSHAFAGDIAISVDIARKNARAMGHEPGEEIKILVLHGVLHLAGYDHERDNGAMARKETELRRRLRLPIGLIERTSIEQPASSRRNGPSSIRSRT